MNKYIILLISIVLLLGFAYQQSMVSTKVNKNHPIIGHWNLSLNRWNGCVESYEFLTNGIRHGTSNLEIVKASYTVTEKPLKSGFYKVIDTVLEDNGKKDCSGSTADMTGDVADLYMSFNANKDRMTLCYEESYKRCFGPFKRL